MCLNMFHICSYRTDIKLFPIAKKLLSKLLPIAIKYSSSLCTVSSTAACQFCEVLYLDSQLQRSTLKHLSPTPRLHLQPVFINAPYKAQQNRGRGSSSSPLRPDIDGNIVREALRYLHPLVQYANNHFHMQWKGSRH